MHGSWSTEYRAAIPKVIWLTRQTVWKLIVVFYTYPVTIITAIVMTTSIIMRDTERVTVYAIVVWKAFSAVRGSKATHTHWHSWINANVSGRRWIAEHRAAIPKIVWLTRQTVWKYVIVFYAYPVTIIAAIVMTTCIIMWDTKCVTVYAIVVWKAFGAVWKDKIPPTTKHAIAITHQSVIGCATKYVAVRSVVVLNALCAGLSSECAHTDPIADVVAVVLAAPRNANPSTAGSIAICWAVWSQTIAELYRRSSTCARVGLPRAENAAKIHSSGYQNVYGINMVIWVKVVSVKNVDLKHNFFLNGVNVLVLIYSYSIKYTY